LTECPAVEIMPKHGFLTPKAIANRIKAKGLQKLKWYCQMCEKQCRDENGFKCHKMSESHQRKMKLFIEAPKKFMNDFSREFDAGFMQILRLKGGRRVKANEVYQDYIANRQHVHMNATVWSTLTGYVLYLGKTGKAKVERAENEGNGKGWYVTYIERDPEVISKQEQVLKMQKLEERERRLESQQIQKIIEKNQKLNKLRANDYQISELNKSEQDDKIAFKFKAKQPTEDEPEQEEEDIDLMQTEQEDMNVADTEAADSKPEDSVQKSRKRKLNNMAALMEENEKRKRRRLNTDLLQQTWLDTDIVVKVKEGEYRGKKGVVVDVVTENEKIKAIVNVLKSKQDIELKVKEKHLETVVPSFGRKVKILRGRYQGFVGVLDSINEKQYSGNIKLVLDAKNRNFDATKIVSIAYEDFSKLNT